MVSQEGIAHRGELEERSRVTESSLRETNLAGRVKSHLSK